MAFIYSIHGWTGHIFGEKHFVWQRLLPIKSVIAKMKPNLKAIADAKGYNPEITEGRRPLMCIAFSCVLGAFSLVLGSLVLVTKIICTMTCHRGAADGSLGFSSWCTPWINCFLGGRLWATSAKHWPLDAWGGGGRGLGGHFQKPFQLYDLPCVRF